MIDLKRWNWLWLLPCALLWLRPNAAAAQNSSQPVSDAEAKCVVSATEDALQNNQHVRDNFNRMLSYIRTQSCQNGEQAAQQDLGMIMQSMLASTYEPVIKKCFLSGLHLNPNVETVWRERQGRVFEVLPYIMQQVFNKVIPRPLCQ